MAPPLLPIAVLALGSAGQAGPPAVALAPPVAGLYRGATAQEQRIALRVGPGGRRASWRIAYRARCDDGARIRGAYRSGDGTPLAAVGPGGTFRVTGEEPARFRGGPTGAARFSLTGQIGPDGGSGTWRVEVFPPRPGAARVSCTSGPVRWGVARG
ncbi:MAG TPA: hypothetical protein VF517_11025 [Thermoleophilaceae bacterium]|jgi:hypothetical protein